jgi:hypothetical protein
MREESLAEAGGNMGTSQAFKSSIPGNTEPQLGKIEILDVE